MHGNVFCKLVHNTDFVHIWQIWKAWKLWINHHDIFIMKMNRPDPNFFCLENLSSVNLWLHEVCMLISWYCYHYYSHFSFLSFLARMIMGVLPRTHIGLPLIQWENIHSRWQVPRFERSLQMYPLKCPSPKKIK